MCRLTVLRPQATSRCDHGIHVLIVGNALRTEENIDGGICSSNCAVNTCFSNVIFIPSVGRFHYPSASGSTKAAWYVSSFLDQPMALHDVTNAIAGE